MSRRLSALGTALLLALSAASAPAVEPLSVSVEGVVAAGDPTQPPPRDAAFQAALLAAVVEAARGLVPPEVVERDAERLREALAPQTKTFVVTYRIGGPLQRRPSALDPGVSEYALPLSARIDGVALRKFLVTNGFLREAGLRPSVVLWTRPKGALALAPPTAALAKLEQTVRAELAARAFVLVEPALRPGDDAEPRSALEQARAVGADVALELEVDWRPTASATGVPGGVAEVRARGLRSDDGSELGLTRFEAAGYAAEPERAVAQALEAVQPQVAENVALQLERNWQALGSRERPVEVELEDVSGLVQVTAVQQALVGSLGATSARLRELRPRAATLEVSSTLSSGSLQERLASLRFEGFALVPVETGPGRARLRVEALPAAPESLAPGQPQIDAPSRN